MRGYWWLVAGGWWLVAGGWWLAVIVGYKATGFATERETIPSFDERNSISTLFLFLTACLLRSWLIANQPALNRVKYDTNNRNKPYAKMPIYFGIWTFR